MSASASTVSRKRVRYTLDVHFSTQEEKETFVRRLKSVRELLTPAGCAPMDNHSLMSAMFDAVEGRLHSTSQSAQDERIDSKCFLSNSGMNTHITVTLYVSILFPIGVYVGDKAPEDQALFLTEKCCFTDLLDSVFSPCSCGMTTKAWVIESMIQVRN